MDRVGLTGDLVVTEPTDSRGGGIVTLDGLQIGNLNDATTVSKIINTIIQKAKANENSGGDPDVNVECVGGKKKIGGVQTTQPC